MADRSGNAIGNVMRHALVRNLVISTVALSAVHVEARTWYIKSDGSGDAPTVQAGIDSAQAGDDVLLAPGVYSWTSQNTEGVALAGLKSGVTLHGQSAPEVTVLDAQQHGRVIACAAMGEVHIANLTIKGGCTTCTDAPTGLYGGGGIYALLCRAVISNCVVRDNQAEFGGGIYSPSGGQIIGCAIVGNRAESPIGVGGGVFSSGCVIEGCTISDNVSTGIDRAGGGGVYMDGGTLRNSIVSGNSASGFSTVTAGGVDAVGAGDDIIGCTFVANRAAGVSALYVPNGSIYECIFARNRSQFGTTIAAGMSAVTACTIIDNDGIGINGGGSIGTTLVAWNTGPACSGSANWVCSDLYGNDLGSNDLCGTDGGGNFSSNPQFCAIDPAGSFNFNLQADSPCAPENHPGGQLCGLIGAAPVGCGVVSMKGTTWSHIKVLFR